MIDYKVFVDIDGVLADFHMGTLEFCGLSLDEWETIVPKGDFWWDKYVNEHMSKRVKYNLMNSLDEEFWEDLELTKDGNLILQILESEFDHICLLSNHANIPAYAAGKVKWINKWHPKYSGAYYLGTNKSFCAGPNRLLIDDADHNCDEFVKAGGEAILIPRYWNKLYDIADCIDIAMYLKERIRLFKQEDFLSRTGY